MKEKNSKALTWGILVSVFLLVLFSVLKIINSPILDLQSQWLIISIIPILIGLIVGKYIGKIKAGGDGFEIELSDPKLISLPDITTVKSTSIDINDDWQSERLREYSRKSDLFLVHVYKPSSIEGQKFDIFVYLARHKEGSVSMIKTGLDDIKNVDFYFGKSWNHKVFTIKNNGRDIIGLKMCAYGTYLATCRVTFTDSKKEKVILYHYIDFEMANAIA